MSDFVQFTLREDVAVLTVNNPPVNVLSPGVPEAIEAALQRAVGDEQVCAIVLMGAGSTFIAGADIREFGKVVSGERGRLDFLPFLLAIEDCPKPVIAAIHGSALGIGLETAMAAHYRVMAANAQVGQPEVKLGLIPGAAGTQRLPRLAGPVKAAEMCALGETVNAQEALSLGIVDRAIEGGLLDGAVAFARECAGKPPVKTRERDEKLRDADAEAFFALREEARKAKRGMSAPLVAIEAVEAATKLSFEEGCKREAELFYECLFSTESQAMIHVFFGERTVGKIPGLAKELKPFAIRRAAVIGAGTMGGGIAMNFANAGIPVIVKEAAQEALDRGITGIRNNYAKTVAKGRLSQRAMDERMALITPQLGYGRFEEADIVVEAVFENVAVKKQVFAEMDKVAKATCILATNTSSLDIDDIASATRRPEMVIGTHFFSPANVMKLLEVVRGTATSDEVVVSAMGLGKKLGKIAVLAKNAFGFIGNRMVLPYLREAYFLVEEGATVEEVNQALYDFGMAMGPLAMDDLAGLDVMWAIRDAGKPFEKAGERQPLVPDLLYRQGRFGQKTGRGWSLYDASRRPSADPDVAALIKQTTAASGIPQRKITPQEIVDRCVYALVNEGARILDEGIALRAVDIDVIYIYGYGFPAWRGGPMFYADTVGLKNVVQQVREPAALLKRLSQEGGTFQSFDRSKEGVGVTLPSKL